MHLFSQEKPLAESGLDTNESASRYIATQLGVDQEAEKELQERIELYDQLQSELAKRYLDSTQKQRTQKNLLYCVNGSSEKENPFRNENHFPETLAQLLLRKSSNNQSCGFYIRWNKTGIVINPGHYFLDNFHQQGFHIKDIQHIIVTKNHAEAYADIKRIYDLNYQLNKLNPDLHVIHYYINQSAYHELSHLLKPNFKQERNSLHCLELFQDSPEVEKEVLAEGILLNYFSANLKGNFSNDSKGHWKSGNESMGIKFDLKGAHPSDKSAFAIAYLSGTSWSPLLSHHLGACDILLTGFGRTHPNDYGKLNYNEDCLGYFGTYSLLEEIKPKLLLCGEFDGSDGDIRLEIIKKLCKESENQLKKHSSIILPFDKGLMVDLNEFLIECSMSKTLLVPQEVRVVRTHNAFGSLQYVSHKCLL